MAGKTDAVLNTNPVGDEVLYDLQIGADGDIVTEDQLDTAILVGLFTDARAASYEIVKPQLRRGWVGDLELDPGESLGSKLWLIDQERLTAAVLGRAADYARAGLQPLVDDGIATSVATRGFVDGQRGVLSIEIRKPNGRADAKFVSLWDKTGRLI